MSDSCGLILRCTLRQTSEQRPTSTLPLLLHGGPARRQALNTKNLASTSHCWSVCCVLSDQPKFGSGIQKFGVGPYNGAYFMLGSTLAPHFWRVPDELLQKSRFSSCAALQAYHNFTQLHANPRFCCGFTADARVADRTGRPKFQHEARRAGGGVGGQWLQALHPDNRAHTCCARSSFILLLCTETRSEPEPGR